MKPKRGLLFRTGKELRDRVNRPPPQGAPLGDLGPGDTKTGTGP